MLITKKSFIFLLISFVIIQFGFAAVSNATTVGVGMRAARGKMIDGDYPQVFPSDQIQREPCENAIAMVTGWGLISSPTFFSPTASSPMHQ